jgi:hypothetical protein
MKYQWILALVLVAFCPWTGSAQEQECVQPVRCPAPGQDLVVALNACISRVSRSCGKAGGTCDARGCGGTYVGNEPLENPQTVPMTVLLGSTDLRISNAYFIDSAGWNDFRLIGQGRSSVITMTGGSTAIRMGPQDASSQLMGVRISGIRFHGTTPLVSDGGIAVDLLDCQECEVDHNWFDTFPVSALFLHSTSVAVRSNRTHIHDNWITNVYGSNILIGSYSEQNEIDHNACHATHCNCIDLNGDRNVVQANVVDTVELGGRCSAGDTRGVNVFQAPDWPAADDNLISDNYIRAPQTQCISVQGSSPNGVSGTKIRGNTCENAEAEGILVSTTNPGEAKDIEVTGNTVSMATGAGILVAAVKGALIANNTVSASQCTSFQFNDARDYVVQNNRAQESNASGSDQQNPGCDGFLFFGSADVINFEGNQDESAASAHSLEVFKTAGTTGNLMIGTNWLPKGHIYH